MLNRQRSAPTQVVTVRLTDDRPMGSRLRVADGGVAKAQVREVTP